MGYETRDTLSGEMRIYNSALRNLIEAMKVSVICLSYLPFMHNMPIGKREDRDGNLSLFEKKLFGME